MGKDKNAEVIVTLHFALGKLRRSSLIENRKMNGASQRKINRIVEAGDIIKSRSARNDKLKERCFAPTHSYPDNRYYNEDRDFLS